MWDKLVKTFTDPWVLFGLSAQFAFMMRFVVQWLASERRGRSYVPVAFWYLSLAGGVMLLTYAVRQRDPVFILGQGLGCFIYVRNLVLIYRRRAAALDIQDARRAAARRTQTASVSAAESVEVLDGARLQPSK